MDVKNGLSKTGSMRGVCPCASNPNIMDCKDYRQENTIIPWFLPHTANRNNNWQGVFGRLEYQGQFQTTITNPELLGKQVSALIIYTGYHIWGVKLYVSAMMAVRVIIIYKNVDPMLIFPAFLLLFILLFFLPARLTDYWLKYSMSSKARKLQQFWAEFKSSLTWARSTMV
jgi:hypothetical protein